MPEYSEQDLRYAEALREEIHREALGLLRKTRPNATAILDPHPVEDYFQQNWEYPGRWYTVVAIPAGYKSRRAFVESLVQGTLAQGVPEAPQDPFAALIAQYPDLAVDYGLVQAEGGSDYAAHRRALKTAFARLNGGWSGDPDRAVGERVPAEGLFSSRYTPGRLNYREAFLYPPHGNGYTGQDFVRVNATLFPKGTAGLEVYAWTTDWSDYFDDGHEWWGALCLTVYDKAMNRFAVLLASATD